MVVARVPGMASPGRRHAPGPRCSRGLSDLGAELHHETRCFATPRALGLDVEELVAARASRARSRFKVAAAMSKSPVLAIFQRYLLPSPQLTQLTARSFPVRRRCANGIMVDRT